MSGSEFHACKGSEAGGGMELGRDSTWYNEATRYSRLTSIWHQSIALISSPYLIVFPKLLNKFRKEIQNARLIMVEGKIQRTETIHVIVQRCFDYTKLLGSLTEVSNEKQPVLTLSRADEKASPLRSRG